MPRDKRLLAIIDSVDELDLAPHDVTIDRLNEYSRLNILINRLYHVDPAMIVCHEELVRRKRKDQHARRLLLVPYT
jgi:hypothetical protein